MNFLLGLLIGAGAACAFFYFPRAEQALAECEYEAEKLTVNAPMPKQAPAVDLFNTQMSESAWQYNQKAALVHSCMQARRFIFDIKAASAESTLPLQYSYSNLKYWHWRWAP